MTPRSTPAQEHTDWLLLVEPDGLFLTLPVLKDRFPDGLEKTPPSLKTAAQARFEKARDAVDRRPYVEWLLTTLLGWENRTVDGSRLGLSHRDQLHGVTLSPDFALCEHEDGRNPRVLVSVVNSPPRIAGTERAPVTTARTVGGDGWPASPAQRMALLCNATGVELGLVTDGDAFTLVWKPSDLPAGYATWRASLFRAEPSLLDSLYSFLHQRRFLAAALRDTPEAMLRDSARQQAEVADELGDQARRAVQLLVNAVSRADQDRGGALLSGVENRTVYEAVVTVLMRIVILLTAEERKLLPVDNELYNEVYSVGGILDSLRAQEHELRQQLEFRSEAWHRFLALCRAVHGGTRDGLLDIPAYGSRLFDPERYPFLEGRRSGDDTLAEPIAVTDLDMLEILASLQELRRGGETRRLSYRALEVEQIGHVYERLLDHSAVRADHAVLALAGAKGHETETALADIEEAALDNDDDGLISWLSELTGKNERDLRRLLDAPIEPDLARGLRVACGGKEDTLYERVTPWANLLRIDLRGLPLVFRPGALYVTHTSERRDSGTAYTPRELAEQIARHALEPLVYSPGPADTNDASKWVPKSSNEILQLRICDPAVGSGAILVAAGRYLAERLVIAWAAEGRADSQPEQLLTEGDPARLDVNVEALRAVTEKCLYAVDRDPLAVEMAKLSLWLISMAKDRPFSFLDHAIVNGDSLLGVTDIAQIEYFHTDPTQGAIVHRNLLFDYEETLAPLLKAATEARRDLESVELRTVYDGEQKARLLKRADDLTRDLRLVGDLVIGASMSTAVDGGDPGARLQSVGGQLQQALNPSRGLEDRQSNLVELEKKAESWLNNRNKPEDAPQRSCLHWPVAFPEIFSDGGRFDVMVGNPPFKRGKGIKASFGGDYREHLVEVVASGQRASADLVAYFFNRARHLANSFGFLAINSLPQVDSRTIGLQPLVDSGWTIYRARTNVPWPNKGPDVCMTWATRWPWLPLRSLNGQEVTNITASLDAAIGDLGHPQRLAENENTAFQGSVMVGEGFMISPATAAHLIRTDKHNVAVVMPFLNGEDAYATPDSKASRWAINFFDRTEAEAKSYPECYEIIEREVRPERQRTKEDGSYVLRKPLPQRWWQYGDKRPALYGAIAGLERVLVITVSSRLLLPVFVSPKQVLGHKLAVIALDDDFSFGVLSSSFHVVWTATQMKPGVSPTYSPRDHFGTFPRPSPDRGVAKAARKLNTSRQAFMDKSGLGMTKTYGLINRLSEQSASVNELRTLHVELDSAVREAYGWTDLHLEHDFVETTLGMRYTVTPPVAAKIYERLLRLNGERANTTGSGGSSRPRQRRRAGPGQQNVFEEQEDDE